VADGAIVHPATEMTVGHLRVEAGGVVSHLPGAAGSHLRVQQDATVEPGGRIDVTACGHGSSAGEGAGVDAWRGSGAGYGGYGGDSDAEPGGTPYGGEQWPVDLGSGGGTGGGDNVKAGSGGGAVRLSVGGTLTVDGEVLADGAAGDSGAYFTASGGGSGGSILIQAATIAGAGLLSVRGGDGYEFEGWDSYSGGGAGGRIAVYATLDEFAGIIDRDGGAHGAAGSGTLHLGEQHWGDHDGDGDVDLGDFGGWEVCVTGPDNAPYAAGCGSLDLDFDDDVDLADFAAFQRAFTGS